MIFRGIKALADQDFSMPALIDKLREMHVWSDTNDPKKISLDTLLELQEHSSTPGSLPGNFRLLNEAYRQRTLFEAANDILDSVKKEILPNEDLTLIENKLHDYSTSLLSKTASTLTPISESVQDILSNKPLQFVQTGITPLDNILIGMWEQDVLLLAGRPSQGKTALALSIILNVARGNNVILYSLEMSASQINQRLCAMLSGIPLATIRKRTWAGTDHQDECLHRAVKEIMSWNVLISDRSVSVNDIKAELLHMPKPIGLIVIDYIQLLTPDDRRLPREQQISGMSRSIKAMAKQFNCPFLVLSQLNRASQEGAAPQLHHLRESGALEQDADVVMAINKKGPDINLHVLKHRNGPIGEIKLYWEPAITRFGSYS